MSEAQRPSRPVLASDLSRLAGAMEHDPGVRRDTAHESAASVLRAGRANDVDLRALLELEETVGLDELGELWRHTDRASLPATLWTMYLLRTWCHRRGEDVCRLWQVGTPHAEVAAAVAGLPAAPTPADAATFADDLLEGVYRGDLPTSLQRAAGFFRVVAAARADLPDTGHAAPELGFGALGTAEDLDRAAADWRAGVLH